MQQNNEGRRLRIPAEHGDVDAVAAVVQGQDTVDGLHALDGMLDAHLLALET
jgi:hypothetical protein